MRVAVIGTGYVGLVTGACLARLGHHVACVDLVAGRAEMIQRGEAPFFEPGLAALLVDAVGAGRLSATTDHGRAIAASEVTFIAVGTPSRPDGEIELSSVRRAAEAIGEVLADLDGYHVVVVKSTVVPGTTEGLVKEALELRSGRKVGEFGLCMNPEFLREGSAVADFMNPDRIVIGCSDTRAGERLALLYEKFDCPKLSTTLANAEMIKYSSNCLLATLISLSNELAAICEVTPGTDVEQVMAGLHLDRRLSPLVDGRRIAPEILGYLHAGVGYGGSCLPKDVKALRAHARSYGIEPKLLDAVSMVNQERPARVVELLARTVGGTLSGRSIAVLGLTFKPGTDDLRDSPALPIIAELGRRGALVKAYDPFVPPSALLELPCPPTLCSSSEQVMEGVDAAALVTAWPEFAAWNWPRLVELMRGRVILDGRNALRQVQLPREVIYLPIGTRPC